MRKYNLTALLALTFITNAGYGMDDTGGAAFFSDALPTSAVAFEEPNLPATAPAHVAAPACGGTGEDLTGEAGTSGTGEADVATLMKAQDDTRMEGLRTCAKKLISLRETLADRKIRDKVPAVLIVTTKIYDDAVHGLKFIPSKLWDLYFKVTSKEASLDSSLQGTKYQGFTAMTNEAVDENITQAKRIRDRDMSPLSMLATSESSILRKKTDAHTTLVLGCGRTGDRYAACPNHAGDVNPHHYTVDMDRSRNPELFGSFSDQRVWNTLGQDSFDEIIMEGVIAYTDIRFMRAAFKALRPGGVLRVMHIQPTIFLDKALTPSVDVPLFSSFQNFTGKSLLDLSLNDYLTTVIGFERVEIYRQKTLDKGKRGEYQWRAFKAGGDSSSKK